MGKIINEVVWTSYQEIIDKIMEHTLQQKGIYNSYELGEMDVCTPLSLRISSQGDG